jgi:drug/metabolite transporter (DMT)-like permease
MGLFTPRILMIPHQEASRWDLHFTGQTLMTITPDRLLGEVMSGRLYAKGPVYAVIAAALFGASTPLAKLLIGDIDPVLLASLLYLGSGAGIFLLRWIRHISEPAAGEARLEPRDYPWLAGAILAGGVIAPISLFFGLQTTPAATASLLLNFEIVATTLIAALIFAEYIGRRIMAAIVIITIASIMLSWNATGQIGFSFAAAAIIAACVFWGVDNNLTRMISGKDPMVIATVKGFCAGGISLALAVITGSTLPAFWTVAAVLGVGVLTYGVSIVLFVRSLRDLGAARTSAYFAAAPFIGSFLSLLIFQDVPGAEFFISLPLFLAGVLLLASERHVHRHLHERMVHVHRHRHDEHHTHPHAGEDIEEHVHEHIHEPIDHEHSHAPDIHHRHER